MKSNEELKKYREMDTAKLMAEVSILEKKLAQDNLKVLAGKLGNFSLISKTKKNIARIYTIINEKA